MFRLQRDITICFSQYVLRFILKGRDNSAALMTAIVLAVFDSCAIWFISFQYTHQLQ